MIVSVMTMSQTQTTSEVELLIQRILPFEASSGLTEYGKELQLLGKSPSTSRLHLGRARAQEQRSEATCTKRSNDANRRVLLEALQGFLEARFHQWRPNIGEELRTNECKDEAGCVIHCANKTRDGLQQFLGLSAMCITLPRSKTSTSYIA